MATQGHTAVHKGKRVLVFLWDGRKFLDKFEGKDSHYLFFKRTGKMRISWIKKISIYKPRSREAMKAIDDKLEKNIIK